MAENDTKNDAEAQAAADVRADAEFGNQPNPEGASLADVTGNEVDRTTVKDPSNTGEPTEASEPRDQEEGLPGLVGPDGPAHVVGYFGQKMLDGPLDNGLSQANPAVMNQGSTNEEAEAAVQANAEADASVQK